MFGFSAQKDQNKESIFKKEENKENISEKMLF